MTTERRANAAWKLQGCLQTEHVTLLTPDSGADKSAGLGSGTDSGADSRADKSAGQIVEEIDR